MNNTIFGWRERLRNASLAGKSVFGCVTLLLITCLCGVPLALISPDEDEPAVASRGQEIALSVGDSELEGEVAKIATAVTPATETAEPTQPPKATPTLRPTRTPLPKSTDRPTATRLPSRTPTATKTPERAAGLVNDEPSNTPQVTDTPGVELADNEQLAVVISVTDGDTIRVDLEGQDVPVQMIGINAPEFNEPCGPEAAQSLASLVQGVQVQLVRDVSETDQFSRLLRYVYVGNIFVNAEMVRQGYAQAVQYPPDTAQAAYLERMAAAAPILACRQIVTAVPAEAAPPGGPPAQVPAFCTCTGVDLNCRRDFNTHAEAQACYDYCRSLGFGDVYGLDGRDDDGLACETLP